MHPLPLATKCLLHCCVALALTLAATTITTADAISLSSFSFVGPAATRVPPSGSGQSIAVTGTASWRLLDPERGAVSGLFATVSAPVVPGSGTSRELWAVDEKGQWWMLVSAQTREVDAPPPLRGGYIVVEREEARVTTVEDLRWGSARTRVCSVHLGNVSAAGGGELGRPTISVSASGHFLCHVSRNSHGDGEAAYVHLPALGVILRVFSAATAPALEALNLSATTAALSWRRIEALNAPATPLVRSACTGLIGGAGDAVVCFGGFSPATGLAVKTMQEVRLLAIACPIDATDGSPCTGAQWLDRTADWLSVAPTPPPRGGAAIVPLALGGVEGTWGLVLLCGGAATLAEFALARLDAAATSANGSLGAAEVWLLTSDRWTKLSDDVSPPLPTASSASWGHMQLHAMPEENQVRVVIATPTLSHVATAQIEPDTSSGGWRLSPHPMRMLWNASGTHEAVDFPSALWGASAVEAFGGGIALYFGAFATKHGDFFSPHLYFVSLPSSGGGGGTGDRGTASVTWRRSTWFANDVTDTRVGASCVAIAEEPLTRAAVVCVGGLAPLTEHVVAATGSVSICVPFDASDEGLAAHPPQPPPPCKIIPPRSLASLPPRAQHTCAHRLGTSELYCAGGVETSPVSVKPATFSGVDGRLTLTGPLRRALASGKVLRDLWRLDLAQLWWSEIPIGWPDGGASGSTGLRGSTSTLVWFAPGPLNAGDILVVCCSIASNSTRAFAVTAQLSGSSSTQQQRATTLEVPEQFSDALVASGGSSSSSRVVTLVSSGAIAVVDPVRSITTTLQVLKSQDENLSPVVVVVDVRDAALPTELAQAMRSAAEAQFISAAVAPALGPCVSPLGVLARFSNYLMWLPPPLGKAAPVALLWIAAGAGICTNASSAAILDCVACGPFARATPGGGSCGAVDAPGEVRRFWRLHDVQMRAALIAAFVLDAPQPTVTHSLVSGVDKHLSELPLEWLPQWGLAAASAAAVGTALVIVSVCSAASYLSRRRVLRRHTPAVLSRWSQCFLEVSADGVTVTVTELERALQDLFPKPTRPREFSDSDDSSSESDAAGDHLNRIPGFAMRNKHLRGRMTGLRELFLHFDRRGLGYLDFVQFVQCCEYIKAVVAEERRYREEKNNYRQQVAIGDDAKHALPAADRYIRDATFDISVDQVIEERARKMRVDEVKRRIEERRAIQEGVARAQEERKGKGKRKSQRQRIRRIYPASTAGRLGLFNLDIFGTSHTGATRVGEPIRYSRTNSGGCWTVLLVLGVVLTCGFLVVEHFAERVPVRVLRPLHDAPSSLRSSATPSSFALGPVRFSVTFTPRLESVAASNTLCLNMRALELPPGAAAGVDGADASLETAPIAVVGQWQLSCFSDAQSTAVTLQCDGCNVTFSAPAGAPLARLRLHVLPAEVNVLPQVVTVRLETTPRRSVRSIATTTIDASPRHRIADQLAVAATIIPQALDVRIRPIWPLQSGSAGAEPGPIDVLAAPLLDDMNGSGSGPGLVGQGMLIDIALIGMTQRAAGAGIGVTMMYDTRTNPRRTTAQLACELLGVVAGAAVAVAALLRGQEALLNNFGATTSAARKRKAQRVFHVVRDKYGGNDETRSGDGGVVNHRSSAAAATDGDAFRAQGRVIPSETNF